jgi:hypothetical protein
LFWDLYFIRMLKLIVVSCLDSWGGANHCKRQSINISMNTHVDCPNVVSTYNLRRWNQNPTYRLFKVHPLAGTRTHGKASKRTTPVKIMGFEISTCVSDTFFSSMSLFSAFPRSLVITIGFVTKKQHVLSWFHRRSLDFDRNCGSHICYIDIWVFGAHARDCARVHVPALRLCAHGVHMGSVWGAYRVAWDDSEGQ